MSENFQYQLSVSLPPSEQYAKGDMINIRGNNAQEFYTNLQNFNAQMAEVAASVVADIRAKWTVIRDAGGTVVPSDNPQNGQTNPNAGGQGYAPTQQQNGPQGGYQQQSQGPPQGYQPQGEPQGPPPNAGGPPECSHGLKTFKSGEKNGRKWQAWMCPAPQNDPTQHKPEWINSN